VIGRQRALVGADRNPSTDQIIADYGMPSNECKELACGVSLHRENEPFVACILHI